MTLLDRLAGGRSLRARASREVAAAPPRVFRAIGEVTAAELPAAGLPAPAAALLRRLCSERGGKDEPLVAQVLCEGFAVLGSDPLREVVLGRRPRGRLVAGVLCEPAGRGSLVRAEVRARPGAALPLLAPLWLGAGRRVAERLLEAWLEAVRRRAEA